MIPRRLHVRNFLSYRECTVDLAGLHLAVLCGHNGDGKTALLDAMTWALWGEARGRLEDDLIHLTEGEMLVEFEFEIDGDCFAAIRKRSRGKTGSLELLQLGPDGARVALTGGTIRETQAELLRRLRMDYDTFVNSAFIAQGRANEFTRKDAARRKEVFRKILGLERYEELAGAANDRKREATAKLLAVGRDAEEMRIEAAKLPGVEEELGAEQDRQDALAPTIAAADAELVGLRQAAADYARLERDVDLVTRRNDEAAKGVAAGESGLRKLEGDLAAIRAVLQKGDEIAARYSELVTIREAEHDMAGRQAAAVTQERAIDAARGAVAQERVRLESSLATLERDTAAAEAAVAALPGLRGIEIEVRTGRKQLEDLDRRLEEARAAEGQLRARSATARADAEQYKQQAQAIKAKEAQLDGVANCPVCRQPLMPDDLDHVRSEYAEQRRTLGEQYREALASADRLETDADAARAGILALQEERRSREDASRARERDLQGRLPAALAAEAALPGLVAALAEARATLDGEVFAADARQALGLAESKLATIGYDAAAHQRLRATVRGLAGAEEAYREHSMASTRADGIVTAIERETAVLADRRSALSEAQEALAAARVAFDAANDVTPRLRGAESALAELRAQEQESVRKLGRLEQLRDHLRSLKAKLETSADETRALKEEELVFGDLALAFGKNGVQAMLIEQSLPRLQNTANDMLDRMTGGRIQVTLHTQRQNQKGNIVETLDIRISDDLGGRDYEMYSGGEAFRVDFALRIALAKLLAERAGASLPTLIIDEGFGTQDQEGIDSLVEAINSIADQFRLILVVTHIEELKGRFDRRIEVTKDHARGSIATVV